MARQEDTETSLDGDAESIRIWPRILIFSAICAAWWGLSRVLPLGEWTGELLASVKALGPLGPLAYALLYIPCCVAMLPDVVPNMAAGALWGVIPGTLTALVGRTLGASVTFLLVRTLARRWIEKKAASDARFAAISRAIEKEGFKIVLLLRLCPIFPVIFLNYAVGLTPISLRAYAAATFIGMIPRTLAVAYAGSGARSLAELTADTSAQSPTSDPTQTFFFWAGFVLTILAAALIARMAHRILREATEVSGSN